MKIVAITIRYHYVTAAVIIDFYFDIIMRDIEKNRGFENIRT